MKGDKPNSTAGVKLLQAPHQPTQKEPDDESTSEDPPQTGGHRYPAPVCGLSVGGSHIAPRLHTRRGAATAGTAGAGGGGRNRPGRDGPGQAALWPAGRRTGGGCDGSRPGGVWRQRFPVAHGAADLVGAVSLAGKHRPRSAKADRVAEHHRLSRLVCDLAGERPGWSAVQEVDGEAALSRVVEMEVSDVHVNDCPKGSLNGQQNTGFAVKRRLTVVRQPGFKALDVHGDGRLCYGARIDLTHHGQTLQLLPVHLKSRCVENASTSSTCETRLAQVPIPEGWIDEAAKRPTPFIVLGDVSRRVTQPADRVRADLDDGEPTNADLTIATQDMPINCRDNTFTEFIDHIVVDRRFLPWVDRTAFHHITHRQADKAVWDQISDHCPVLFELWIR
jgi:endonuclease/exonuclease/phosphatase family metal-dependent hydrolase